jgi:Ca2+-binding RTX toxin-like protein
LNPLAATATRPLTTGVDTGAAFTGTARNDTFNASQLTLNAGDSLVGGDGTDTLQITSNAAAAVTVGGDALVSGIEVVNTTATVSAVTANLSTFSGVTTVGSSGSTAAVSYNGLTAIPTVNLSGTSANVDVAVAAAAVVGLADAATINLTSVGSTASNSVTINGVEAITVNTTGNIGATQIDGVTINRTTIASTTLNSVTVNGSGSANLAVSLAGAPLGATATPGVFTGSAGADDVVLTIPAGSRLTANLGTGNDTLRLSAAAAAMTVNGGDGTDTLVYSGAAAAAADTANITGFENVVMGAGVSFALATSNLTYAVAAGGTYTGLAAGGTVALTAGGTLTLANAALTGTTDAVTVTVGTAAATAPTAATIAAGTFDVVTVTGVARSDTLASTSAAISVSGTTLNTVTLNSSQGVALAGGGAALTTINASGVAGNFSSTAATSATAGLTITTGAGNDVINGGALGDTLNGGAGNDTITGGVGADRMTGGTGADTFVIEANTAAASSSTGAAPDVISDFLSGTDKLNVGAAAFLGNFTNIQQALAANAATGVVANSAAFVTGESNLYVFTTPGAALTVLDRVVTLTGVSSISGADLLIGAQGAGATITATASTAPAISPTATIAGQATTNFDDTISASSPATGTSSLTNGAINGGLGTDTLNATVNAIAQLTGLTAAGANTVALTSIENVNITSTLGDVLVLGANIPTDLRALTVSSSDVNGVGLQATTTAANQSITVNSTVLAANAGRASNITVANFANARVTTASGNDVITVNGGADTTGLNVNAGAGDDLVVLSAATVLTGTGNVLNGGANASATTAGDTLRFNFDAGDVNLATLATAGTISGFEVANFAADQAGGGTYTLATGFTGITFGATAGGNEVLNVRATAAQATALVTLATADAADVGNLVITDAGSVSLANPTGVTKDLSGLDGVTWAGTLAVSLTTHAGPVAVTQTGAGTAAQSVTLGDTLGANNQSWDTTSTGTVDFNTSVVRLGAITAAADGGNLTLVSAAGATTSLNITGAVDATTPVPILFNDADLIITNANLDNINVGGVTGAGARFDFGTGNTAQGIAAAVLVNAAETGTAQVSYTFATDETGTANQTLRITGFDAAALAAGGDVLDLSGTGGGNAVLARTVTTGGASLTGAAIAAGAVVEMIIGNTAASQIVGALTQTTDAGAVEAAILALGLVAADDAATNIYITLDNGTDTGVYRVTLDGAGNTLIDTAAEITSVVLVATLTGVADVGLLGAFNFA